MSNLNCTIPLIKLQDSPFNLTLGDSVFATLTASNVYGESSPTPVGNGGTIVLVPDSP